MTSSKTPSKAQTRPRAPTMAHDQASAALVKLMQVQQAALNSAKAGAAPGASSGHSHGTAPPAKKGGRQ